MISEIEVKEWQSKQDKQVHRHHEIPNKQNARHKFIHEGCGRDQSTIVLRRVINVVSINKPRNHKSIDKDCF